VGGEITKKKREKRVRRKEKEDVETLSLRFRGITFFPLLFLISHHFLPKPPNRTSNSPLLSSSGSPLRASV